jgi:hypothetical protein
LEQQTAQLPQQTHRIERGLRWWRGLACSLVVLAVLAWALPSGTAQEVDFERGRKGLAHRVAALEKLLKRSEPAHWQWPGQHRLRGCAGRGEPRLSERAG